jgi:hypothetical protein
MALGLVLPYGTIKIITIKPLQQLRENAGY